MKMKPQRTILLFLGMLCLGFGVYLLASFLLPSLNAHPSTLVPAAQVNEIISPTEVRDFLTNKTVYDSPDALPSVTVDEIKADLTALEQINLKYVRRPGWWHIVRRTWTYTHEIDQQNQGENAEWHVAGLLPPVKIFDRWFQITDEEGSFGKADFFVISDESGNPVQVLVSDEEGNGGNLTMMEHELPDYPTTPSNIAAEIDARPPQKADSDLRDMIEWLEKIRYISEIQAGLIRDDGDEAYFLRIQTHVHGEPYEMQWPPEPVIGFILTYQIDPTTGNVIEMTDTAVGASGGEYLEMTETLLISERYDHLPDEARHRWLAYMDQYWMLVENQGSD